MANDYIFRGNARELDPELSRLVDREDQRQAETVILIASESACPAAVQEMMATDFSNVYAEGYPRPESRLQGQGEILDLEAELAHYRRYSDPRYYKGVEYADVLEALARRRAAELFATNGVSPDDLYVNVQSLSGSPANIAVYSALLEHGDTIMGLDLNHGGHLTHGSKISRSGKAYNAVSYTVDLETEQLDYEAIEAQARQVRPKLIVAGFTAYPLIVDWQRFKAIADNCGAYLMADIAHISGLVVAGVHPSPIGIADVVTTTTHKSLCGPRGAMILTHRKDIAGKVDRSVFPGEQGGPHLNTIAAMALAFKLAKTEQFRALQQRVVRNAACLANKLAERGLRIVAGGSENHLLLIDTKSVSHDGVHLSGDMAARILDVAGIVTNRNTIPGDKSAFASTGIRIGTVWISQLGYGDAEMDLLAEAIATVLKGCQPFTYDALGGKEQLRAKVDYAALQRGRTIVRQLTRQLSPQPAGDTVEIRGAAATGLLNDALTSDVLDLADGQSQPTHLFTPGLSANGTLRRLAADRYHLRLASAAAAQAVVEWINALSDGYVQFDDLYAKLPGPVIAKTVAGQQTAAPAGTEAAFADHKPYFVGWQNRPAASKPLPPFNWEEPVDAPLRRTQLYDTHVKMGARMVPFGGWDMPVWYTSVSEEHNAVRQAAGLFDVSHMGVLEASGPHAAEFLNLVTTNDISTLEVGESHYTYLLFPDGSVVDDLLVYRRGPEKFMLVVNASNNDKDWAWLTAVNEGRVQIDPRRPWARVQQPAGLRDLRDLQWGDECRVDIALQGPRATEILLKLADDPAVARRIKAVPWAGLTEGKVAGLDLVISRTGYTGERVAYELFVHPDQAVTLWEALLQAGQPLGLKPCGLAARDSTRTEAGLPLYGHELAGPLGLNPGDAGFASYIKLWKPFFAGREATMAHEQKRDRVVVRFRMNEKGVRRPELGDPVLDKRGKVIGTVTSCAIDSEGYLLGQAVVHLAMAEPGTPLAIYQLGGGQRPLRAPEQITPGARLPIPDGATVLTRFPARKK
ncbi:MAG: glycine cleavage system aminomethyltransferase GcvT [Chloroflexi bacterium]|nr:glycine cleavage system aminomethyltransferase GcvT [Chloroflexota bacterium]MCI0575635.1 glycine cleavage system aminomethyltransferase GcvT [Chloroflexota bacterium]MCI0643485.1 glycine cleavage system aminomethyltransferase GcvT [Chloroflexota bacterium]